MGAVQDPVEGVALTRVYPDGNASLTLTPVAGLGPLLVAVMVKVTLLPTFGVALLTVLVIERLVQRVSTITTSADTEETQPASFVTVKVWVPAANPVMIVVVVEPVMAPGLIVQFPDGKPLKITLPVEVAQVGWVIVLTVGAVGIVLIVALTEVLVALLQPVVEFSDSA